MILFFMQHSKIKRNGSEIINNIKLLTLQNSDRIYINLSFLYYYRKIFACLLTNLSIQLSIINKTKKIVYKVIFNYKNYCKLF